MARYLIRVSNRKKTIDYVRVPKNAHVVRRKNGYVIRTGGRTGALFAGYKKTRSKNAKTLVKRVVRRITR